MQPREGDVASGPGPFGRWLAPTYSAENLLVLQASSTGIAVRARVPPVSPDVQPCSSMPVGCS